MQKRAKSLYDPRFSGVSKLLTLSRLQAAKEDEVWSQGAKGKAAKEEKAEKAAAAAAKKAERAKLLECVKLGTASFHDLD
jgi:hypothetical protein